MLRFQRLESSKPVVVRGRTSLRAGAQPALLAAIALALAALTTGCGETTKTPAAAAPSTTAASASTSTAAPATASTTGTGATPAAVPPTKTASGSLGGGRSHRTSKAHLVLPPPGSHPEPPLSASQRAHVAVADIALSSPAIVQSRSSSAYALGQQYTCRGSDRSPPLHWGAVPADTKELVLFVLSTQPVANQLFFDWSVADLSPSLRSLQAGALPAGAVVGRNGLGHAAYTICPANGKRESYVFMLYALPQKLSSATGFDPAALRQQAIQLARHAGLLVGTAG
ncbi:MAG TPA: hypothetical protein VK756_01020 [Solirubrobacteraceae bacterium]|jgi:phosphatidylethanolamine-binding protein (PEBP) family uncharacterized protein|nr:hypothetical protein [Solirubrobacteraceae bacterium]